MINVNDKAPEFNILTDIGNFSLKENLGKNIILFFFQKQIQLDVLNKLNLLVI